LLAPSACRPKRDDSESEVAGIGDGANAAVQGISRVVKSGQAMRLVETSFTAADKASPHFKRMVQKEWNVNVALGKEVTMSSQGLSSTGAENAVNGVLVENAFKVASTKRQAEGRAWLEIDLGADEPVTAVTLWASGAALGYAFMRGVGVELLDGGRSVVASRELSREGQKELVQSSLFFEGKTARYIRVLAGIYKQVTLSEVEVWKKTDNVGEGICWRQSQGRGVGTPLDSCREGEKDGALCYPHCPAGYNGVGPVCWESCPSGWRDDGVSCWVDAHIKGSDNSACPGHDKCGLTFAKGCSKCPEGYKNDGCTCRRDAQNFTKKSRGRTAGRELDCAPGKEKDAGLCYNSCSAGSTGVGPVCWQQCGGAYPHPCGAACASTKLACDLSIGEMVQAPVMAALSIGGMIATAGASWAATAPLRTAAQMGARTAVKQALTQVVVDYATGIPVTVAATAADSIAAAAMGSEMEAQEALLALEPTGLAAVAVAFAHPLCDEE
jgi:hypothetical protein